jgi:hypothetical protein
MTADAFRTGFEPKTFDGVFPTGKLSLASILTFIGYISVFVGYSIIFTVSLLTVGFLEIRQANMSDFNALIAVLEERDGYKDRPRLEEALERVRKERNDYNARIALLETLCFKTAGAPVVMENGLPVELGTSETSGAKPKTCDEIRGTLQRHANELSLTEDDVLFRSANFEFYYDQYKDGITRKAPQIIPALQLLDSPSKMLKIWARSPFELIEMFLLVCMGLLGGVISVMRCFVDPSLKSPAIAEFFYKPAAGAAISLGVYVLFRAAQIFLGVQNQGGAATVSTSVFLLAGLGLASGFCATQALATIESVATRLLRSAGETRTAQADNPRGSASTPGDGPNSGLAAGGATPG